MKILFLISFSLLIGFVSNGVFAETELTGWLEVVVVDRFDGSTESYLYWFQSDDKTTYKLNSDSLPSNILDLAGERVRVTVASEEDLASVSSLDQEEQVLDISSIEKMEESITSSVEALVTARSVTLLSKYSDIGDTPEEDPGTGPGQFATPRGVAVDGSGNTYVADNANHRIQKFDSNGDFVFQFGKNGPSDGQFVNPSGVAVDGDGNIYVVDLSGRVQKFDSNGSFLLSFGSVGTTEGLFTTPFGIAVDNANIYVADTGNHRIQIFDLSGNFLIMFGAGVVDGTPFTFQKCTSSCQVGRAEVVDGGMASPFGVTVDGVGNIFVADTGISRIQKFNAANDFLLKFGTNGGLGGTGTAEGDFDAPYGIAVDGSGNIYVVEKNNHRIQKFNSMGASPEVWGWGVNTGASAFETCTSSCLIGLAGSGAGQLDNPEGIASGSIYVGDAGNDRVKKFNETTGAFESELGFDGSLVHDMAYYQTLFYDGPGSLKNYYDVSSYGNYILDGAVDDWKTLPSPEATYLPNANLLLTDAMTAHEGTVDFCLPTPVTNILLVVNGDVDSGGGAFGSLGNAGGPWPTVDSCGSVTVSVSWLPDKGGGFCCGQTLDRGVGIAAHELGHNLTFEHTPPPPGLWSVGITDPYHDPNSVMSDNKNHEGPSALIMPNRDDSGWVDAGNKVTVADGTSSTITLDFSNEAQGGINPQMITVPLSDGTSYIIEGHTPGLFNDHPQDKSGIMMYKKFPMGNQYAYLSNPADKDAPYSLVATEGTDTESQFDDAILEVGETYEDVANSVTVTTQSKTASSVTVFVSNNAAASCSPPPGMNWVITSDCTLTGNVTADMNITVQDNSLFTIPNGMTAFFDPSTFSITVVSGSGILIESGGSIQTIPP